MYLKSSSSNTPTLKHLINNQIFFLVVIKSASLTITKKLTSNRTTLKKAHFTFKSILKLKVFFLIIYQKKTIKKIRQQRRDKSSQKLLDDIVLI